MYGKISAAAIAVCMAGTGAGAASLTWASYTSSQVALAKSERAAAETDVTVAFEDFESFLPVPSNPGPGSFTPLTTGVGLFTTTAGPNCGGSCSAPQDQSLVRATSGFGRYNTTDSGANWLDSNDNAAINLAASGPGSFDSISFFLTDIDDVGAITFNIDVDGENFDVAQDIFGGKRQGNGGLFYVRIDFDGPVASSMMSLNIDDGDGFGLDDVRLGSVTPVPVPASLPLLIGGLSVLAWGARRRKATAA